jgi:hypothetical protein
VCTTPACNATPLRSLCHSPATLTNLQASLPIKLPLGHLTNDSDAGSINIAYEEQWKGEER